MSQGKTLDGEDKRIGFYLSDTAAITLMMWKFLYKKVS